MAPTRMITIRLPHDLLDQLDQFVADRERTSFIISAIEEKLRRERLVASVQSMAGMVSEDEAPYWGTPEKVSDWVQSQRALDADKGITEE